MTTKDTNPKDAVGSLKVPMSVVSATVIAEIAVGMLEGASKYGRHNYRHSGVRASVYYDAAMRHLMAWWEGEDIDPDSGMSHITKCLTTLVVLRDAQQHGMCTDDRPIGYLEFMPELNERCVNIINRYQHMNPHHYTRATDERDTTAEHSTAGQVSVSGT
jgi:hypothetical protein